MGKKKYNTEEERKAAKRASDTKRYQENRDEIRAQQTEYNSTQKGRANYLLCGYRKADKKYNRGKCTLTADYIVEHIFSQPCTHCGETDWRQIGCNRLDNSLPHTPSNVEPCCCECNKRLGNEWSKELFSKSVYQYTLDGLLVAIWPSSNECGRNGYDKGAVSKCCNGKLKRYKGYKWSYELISKIN